MSRKRAYYRSIPCWYDEENDNELVGRNWFWDFILDLWLPLDFWFFMPEDGFPIYVEKEEDEE